VSQHQGWGDVAEDGRRSRRKESRDRDADKASHVCLRDLKKKQRANRSMLVLFFAVLISCGLWNVERVFGQISQGGQSGESRQPSDGMRLGFADTATTGSAMENYEKGMSQYHAAKYEDAVESLRRAVLQVSRG
jgi:hypothetical protein